MNPTVKFRTAISASNELDKKGYLHSPDLIKFHQQTSDLYSCSSTNDCVQVDVGICHCGYHAATPIVINKKYVDEWKRIRKDSYAIVYKDYLENLSSQGIDFVCGFCAVIVNPVCHFGRCAIRSH